METDETGNGGKVPAALHLPPGKLFFGYPVVPLKKAGEEGGEEAREPQFGGEGKTLRAARKSGNNSSSSSSTSLQGGAASDKGKGKKPKP
ncbi:hypothetical protein HK101_003036 [Irineochytrium annulatum]|nr:hypothetical protein HK101_003036 [Irineochytrium annulatum]